MKYKSFVSILMVVVMMCSLIASNNVKADNSNEERISGYKYTIFAGSHDNDSISFNASNVCVNGNIGTNGTIKSSCSMNVNGTKDEHLDVETPDFYDWIDENNSNNSVIEEDSISIKKDIRFKAEDILTSKTGNITVEAVNADLNGLIYAPNGIISIKAMNLNMNSVIMVADKIIIDCPNINANYNNKLGSVIEYGRNDGTCRVTFALCGVEAEDVKPQIVKSGELAIEPEDPEPISDNYIFVGWYTDKETENYFEFDETPVTKDLVLYAGWYNDEDNTDTDNDGFEDEYEKILGTDILSKDTDKDGITDYDELFYDLDLDPCMEDTDEDGIYDGDEDADEDGISNIEEFKFKTAPDCSDTDSDGLDDGNEVNDYLTDPKNEDTDGDDLDDYKEIQFGTDPLKYNDSFDIVKSINAGDVEEADITFTLKMNGINCEQADSLNVEPVYNEGLFPKDMPGYIGCPYELNMDGEFDKAELTFEYDSKLNDKEDFDPVIYWFDEDEQDLVPLETSVSGNVARAVTTHFSTYVLVDRTEYENSMEWSEIGEVSNYTQAKISIVIDDSGSMKRNDKTKQRLSVARSFVEDLPDNIEASVYSFASKCYKYCDFTNNKEYLIKSLADSKFVSKGNTCLNTALLTALGDYDSDDKETLNIIVMLTDGDPTDGNRLNDIINQANEKAVKIYNVGLGNTESFFAKWLKPVSSNTGGKFFYANNTSELKNIYSSISERINLIRDTDNDGLPDCYEDGIPCFNGKIINTDKNNPDTDGDGLLDGEEVVIKSVSMKSFGKVRVYAKMFSSPMTDDTDKDGLLESGPIMKGNSIIAPKDDDPLDAKWANVWKAHIDSMTSGNVGEYYMDEGSQAKRGIRLKKELKRLVPNKKLRRRCYKKIKWASNFVNKRIRKGIEKNQDKLNEYLDQYEKCISYVLMVIKQPFTGEYAAKLGAYLLNFSYDNKKMAYHSHPETWQKSYGYTELFDAVFRTATSMDAKKFEYDYQSQKYRLWMWKGDYWALGAGSEIGLYKQSKNNEKYFDAVDFLATMQISTYKMKKQKVDNCYFNWNPTTERQWWITAFNWRYKKPKKKDMLMVGKVNLGSQKDMAKGIKEEIDRDSNGINKCILDSTNNTIWLIWR